MLNFGKFSVCSDDEQMYVRNRKTGAVGRAMSLPAHYSEEDYEEYHRSDYEAAQAEERYQDEYKKQVVALIRSRYDADDEAAILRQRDTKPDEFEAYNAYCEECKRLAKAEIDKIE